MAEPQTRARSEVFDALPPPWPEPLEAHIRAELERRGEALVVLDDDPTGTQTVHGLPVLTEWSEAALAAELERSPVFYVLTNSRSLPRDEAVALAREAGRNLRAASERTGRQFSVCSRSDSTLRGHYPAEVDALAETIGLENAGCIIVPYFLEGGRFTIDDVHYVLQGEELVPAAATQFAQDAVFGYQHSRLPEWVEEKTGGRVPAGDVVSITLEDLRRHGALAVANKLAAVPPGGVAVVNSADDRDQEVFVAGLLAAEAAGHRFQYRTAGSFVRVRGGISRKEPLGPEETRSERQTGGLVVVGSYVAKSTEQLQHALAVPGMEQAELNVDALLDGAETEQHRVRELVNGHIRAGRDVVVYTSRTLRTGGSEAESLAIGRRVSEALCSVVSGLEAQPRFLIAKGGITSSDVATRGLGVKRAWVLGPLLPGVPVWELGPESRFPGMAYVVFPGNVGQADSLAEAIRRFRR